MNMKIAAVLFAFLVFLAGCSTKEMYQPYLSAHQATIEANARIDRTIVELEVQPGEILTISGLSRLAVKVPAEQAQYPEMFRDYSQEALIGAIAGQFGIIGQQAFGYLGKREDSKMLRTFATKSGTMTWENAEGGTQIFSGGLGDRDNMGTGTMSESMTNVPEVLDPFVVTIPAASSSSSSE